MAIYLVQHGKSLSKEVDPSRGLSEEGIAETKRIGDVARGYRVNIRKICHSSKSRAAETARIFAEALKPADGVAEIDGIHPMDDVTCFAHTLDTKNNMMIVGHLPFMEKLCAYLVTGNENHPIFRFQNSGVVCLDKDETHASWIIKWALMPNIG